MNEREFDAMSPFQKVVAYLKQEELQQINKDILAMADSRDTKFAGFAQIFYVELVQLGRTDFRSIEEAKQKYERLIAQRAYDLACHVVEHVSEWQAAERETEIASVASIVQDIPDMTAWPDPTLERIIRDVQRVTGHKPSEQIIRDMLAQYEPMKDLIALNQVIQDTEEEEK